LIASQATLRDFACAQRGGALDAELDMLMRFERLDQDFAVVLRAIGLQPQPLPHRNRGDHAPYRVYYGIRPATAAYRDGAEPALSSYGRSLERR
jgi:hypothetical protein